MADAGARKWWRRQWGLVMIFESEGHATHREEMALRCWTRGGACRLRDALLLAGEDDGAMRVRIEVEKLGPFDEAAFLGQPTGWEPFE